jgi:hypothetical protein
MELRCWRRLSFCALAAKNDVWASGPRRAGGMSHHFSEPAEQVRHRRGPQQDVDFPVMSSILRAELQPCFKPLGGSSLRLAMH